MKIIGFCLIVFLAWKLGNKLNKDLDYIEEQRHIKTEENDLNDDEYIEMEKKVR